MCILQGSNVALKASVFDCMLSNAKKNLASIRDRREALNLRFSDELLHAAGIGLLVGEVKEPPAIIPFQ